MASLTASFAVRPKCQDVRGKEEALLKGKEGMVKVVVRRGRLEDGGGREGWLSQAEHEAEVRRHTGAERTGNPRHRTSHC